MSLNSIGWHNICHWLLLLLNVIDAVCIPKTCFDNLVDRQTHLSVRHTFAHCFACCLVFSMLWCILVLATAIKGGKYSFSYILKNVIPSFEVIIRLKLIVIFQNRNHHCNLVHFQFPIHYPNSWTARIFGVTSGRSFKKKFATIHLYGCLVSMAIKHKLNDSVCWKFVTSVLTGYLMEDMLLFNLLREFKKSPT